MPRAKTLNETEAPRLIEVARSTSTQPARDVCLLSLSFYCGLRAQEIARLELRDITDAAGILADWLTVTPHASKGRKRRTIPLPKAAKEALAAYLSEAQIENGPVFFKQCGQPLTSTAVQKQIARLGFRAGFAISSHSGRRTCLTLAARKAYLVGGSLRDVQLLAGHADLSTTESYIEPSGRHAELLECLYRDPQAEQAPVLAPVAPVTIVSPEIRGQGSLSNFCASTPDVRSAP